MKDMEQQLEDMEQLKKIIDKIKVLVENVEEENESLKEEINMLKQNQVNSKPNKEEQSDKVMKNEKSEEMQSQLDEALTSKIGTIVRGPALKLKK